MIVKGSSFGEELFGGAFDDKLVGRGGDDYLFADAGADLLKGGGGSDRLIGEDGKDVLKGGGGDDLLVGGLGKDLLVGGGGGDEFAFGPEFLKGDVDRIAKFQDGKDHFGLYLDMVSSSAPLSKAQFHLGDSAKDGDDLVIYNREAGELFIDFDGKGGEGQIKFAKVDPGLQLSHDDVWLMPLS
jgi:Ca2+-binding RTX toxin-like protein